MLKVDRKLRTKVTATMACTAVTALLAGCGGDDASATGGGVKDGKTTITMGLYGVMGFKETGLIEKYEKEHPKVTVKVEVAGDEQTYFTALQTHLAGGSGLKDIQGIEVGRAKEMTEAHADKFSDFAGTKGAKHFQPWKQSQITTKDGKVLGLGTDTGPMAVCYRKDLFKQAGLPTDREKVGKLWEGDWAKYVEAGEKFAKGNKNKKVSYLDSASGLFNGMVYGNSEQYYDKSGELIYKNNPAVKDAWDLASEAAQKDLTAKLPQFQPGWDPGLANGTFATTVCPAWMLAHISDKAGDANKGKWDVAKAPKGANWGGSFLGVTEKSPVKDEAKKLVAWLTAPEQQAYLFEKLGNFPSSKTALEDPKVKDAESEYFSGAPTGRIFGEAANEVPSEQVLGRKDGTIKDAFSQGLQLVEDGKEPDEAWKSTDERIKKAVG